MRRDTSKLPSWPVLICLIGAGTTMFIAMGFLCGGMALARRFVGARVHT